MEKNVGILDPEGKHRNPLTGEQYSDTYRELSKKWREYPAYQNNKETIKKIRDNNVILVVSGTGSGKTVLIPKYVLHTLDYQKKVAIVLPKQIIAKSSATFAAKTLDVELGDQVGYKYRGEKKMSENTKLLYTTDGTLVSMLMKDNMLNEYSCVIIDEAHERRVQTDFLLYLLKEVCGKRPDFKLIIMSATIDERIFHNYFKNLQFTSLNISGKTNYPIVHEYMNEEISKSKYLEYGLKKINEIIETTKDGDILFFVPNILDTFSMCHKITSKSKTSLCLEVYAGMNKEKEELVESIDLYKKKHNGKTRKIIIATNVAESSLTIEGIQYVIDSGYENFSYFDPKIESKVMDKRMVSKAQIKQRCGRTGRTGKGICYHLYTNDEYENLEDYPEPAVKTTNICGECLNLLAQSHVDSVEELVKILNNFIEPPPKIQINYAINSLENLKLVENNKITQLGRLVSELSVEPSQGIAIFTAWKLKCMKEVISIICVADVTRNNLKDLFQKVDENNEREVAKFNKAKKGLFKKKSDHYTIMKIMKNYKMLKGKGENELNNWLNQNCLKRSTLEKAYSQYKKLLGECMSKKWENTNDNITAKLGDRILASFFTGYSSNIAEKNNKGYKTPNVSHAKISKDSWMFDRDSKRILYTEMFTTNGTSYLQINSYISSKVMKLVL
jgi:pre-mRNA-splicing factor ATP-dependent RNA helicase DHX15/PRP43